MTYLVTAIWERKIVVGRAYYNVFEINKKYYITRPYETTVTDVESKLNFEAGASKKALQYYTVDSLRTNGDDLGVLIVIQKPPTWRPDGPKCECGGWVIGAGHDSWYPAGEWERLLYEE